jgi:hypothetical protein
VRESELCDFVKDRERFSFRTLSDELVHFVRIDSDAVGRRWPALVESVTKAFQALLETPSIFFNQRRFTSLRGVARIFTSPEVDPNRNSMVQAPLCQTLILPYGGTTEVSHLRRNLAPEIKRGV